MRWLVRIFSQWICVHKGRNIIVPVTDQQADSPKEKIIICMDCGKILVRLYTDNAEMETREC